MTVSWTFAAAWWAIDLRWFWFEPTTESARSKWLAYEAKAWPKLHSSQHACFLLLVFFPFLSCLKILEHLRCHAFCLAQFYELLLLALIEYFAAVGSSVKLDCSKNTCTRGFLKFPSKNYDRQGDFLVPGVQTNPYTSSNLRQNGLVNRNLAAGLKQNSRSATTLPSNASMGRH